MDEKPLASTDSGDVASVPVENHDALSYSAETDSYHASFDGAPESASIAIVSMVANASGTPAMELPPLYEACDPDALDTVVESNENIRVSFPYNGHDVSIVRDGSIAIQVAQTDEGTTDRDSVHGGS